MLGTGVAAVGFERKLRGLRTFYSILLGVPVGEADAHQGKGNDGPNVHSVVRALMFKGKCTGSIRRSGMEHVTPHRGGCAVHLGISTSHEKEGGSAKYGSLSIS